MRAAAATWLCTLALALPAFGAAPERGVRSVELTGPRVLLGELVPGGEALGEIDLGQVPAPGGSRVITRAQSLEALADRQIQGVAGIPASVRVVRKMTALDAPALRTLAREALANGTKHKGLALVDVRPPRRVTVATGWRSVSAKVPKPPRRAGPWPTSILLAFDGDEGTLARVSVPVTFEVSPEAAEPDVAKGGPVTLIIRSGLVEIRTKAVAGAAADVGDIVPLTLHPSGRVVRARLVTKGEALALGTEAAR